MEYRKVPICKICKLNSSNLSSDDIPNSIYYLDTGNITKNKIANLQFLHSSKDNFPSRAKRRVRDKTIIYSTVRPIQEHYGIIENPVDNLIVSTGFTTIDCIDKNVDAKFLYYYLTQPSITKYLQGIAENSVSAYPSIKSEDIGNLIIEIPKDLYIQKQIASILASLDKKIELNNKINQKLETMAKMLYDYWFVQFDFPDANGKPYKSSGGKMVYNKELKREIPEGWSCLKLEEIITHSGTGLNPRQNFKLGNGNNFYVTIKNIKQGRVILDSKCDRIDDEVLEIINRRSDLKAGDILFTSIQPVGVTYLIYEKPKNWNINESVFVIRPNYNLVSSEYLYMLLSSEEMKLFTTNSSAGSIHKGIRHTVLKTFQFPFSGEKIINKFTKILHPVLKRMYINEQENQKLTQLRDWLLPMLMNGQVKIFEAANIVQDVLMVAEPETGYGVKES